MKRPDAWDPCLTANEPNKHWSTPRPCIPIFEYKKSTSTSATHQESEQRYRCRHPCKIRVSIWLYIAEESRGSYMSHCNVENLTASTRSRKPATSCSIRVSVSLIRISCPLASSRIRPFSRFRSRRTDAWVRPISSRRREFSLARSAEIFSWDERVSCASVESVFRSSERSLAKSTFWVYVDLSESMKND